MAEPYMSMYPFSLNLPAHPGYHIISSEFPVPYSRFLLLPILNTAVCSVGLPGGSVIKNLPINAGDTRALGSIPGFGEIP